MNDELPETERTRLRRRRERGHFDRQTIHGILDAMPMCHVGCAIDGTPVVMPTLQWREGDSVYWHASGGGRGVKAWVKGPVCLTVSILDGLVLARSGLHHSANYRSVMVFGQPRLVEDPTRKNELFNGLIEALYPGRSRELRPLTPSEIKRTAILSLPIAEASAKIRAHGAVDEEADYDWPVWSGVVPVRLQVMQPEPDPRNIEGIDVPDYVRRLTLG